MRLSSKEFAKEKHLGQVRKYNGEPYFNHVDRVASIVRGLGSPDRMVDAAFLHDVMEDCGIVYAQLKGNFGKDVANLVLELTNVYTKENYPKLNRAKRHELEIRRQANISKEAKIIKLADRWDNLRDMCQANVERGFAIKYANESIDLLSAVGDAHDGLANNIRDEINKIFNGHEMVSSK